MADLTTAQATQSVSLTADGVGEASFGASSTDSTTLRSASNAYGIVQTSAPSAGTNATVKQLTLDALGRMSTPLALNVEWGQMFSVTTNSQALTGLTETPFFYFQNPNASGKTAKIWRISIEPTLGNNYVTYKFYRDPTVTVNGTGLNEVGSRDTGQAANVINTFFAPTTSANGSVFRVEIDSGLSGAGIEVQFDFGLWVEANHGLLITRTISANATIGGINIEWAEQA